MKKIFMTALMAVALVMTACSNDSDEQFAPDGSPVKMTFAITGDFTLTTTAMTRAALQADGKDMTDVWVLDYMDGTLVQQLHQTAADDDFGTPTLSLAIGTHHVYIIASRGQSPTLDTDAHTLTFAKVLDTFWTDCELTVTSGTTSGSRAVALDRIVTKLKVLFTDAIPTGAATFSITPAAWHYGLDYTTGNPTAATASQAVTVNIPSTSIGKTGESINVFGFSGPTEWTTDVAISCKDGDGNVLGSAVIDNAPFLRNRVSEYTGPLFSAGSGMTLSLNATWSDAYIGEW